MKKVIIGALSFCLGLALVGCGAKTTTNTTKNNGTTTKANTTKANTTKANTTKTNTTASGKPVESKMAVLEINSKTGKNNFLSDPVAKSVKEQEKTWGGTEYASKPEPYYEDCEITLTNSKGNVKLEDEKAKVKVRGNWTTTYDKKPIRIKFDKAQSMLGLNGGGEYKNWVLLAGYKDWSLLRDATALFIADEMGDYYASDYEFVEVYANGTYWGVYILAELQEERGGRVDITPASNDPEGFHIGYFIEYDSYYKTEDNYFEMNYIGNIKTIDDKTLDISKVNKGYTIKSDITTEKTGEVGKDQIATIQYYMNSLWDICYSAIEKETPEYKEFNDSYQLVTSTATNAKDCIAKVVDLDSLVETYILQELACDPDIYYSSFYMDIDLAKGVDNRLKFEAPWDFDSAFGDKNFCANAQGYHCSTLQYEVNNEEYGYGNPWLILFAKCDWFQDMVKEKWTNIYNKGIFTDAANQIDEISALYVNEFARNYSKWGNIGKNELVGNELTSGAAACKTEAEAAAYLKNWLNKRVAYLDGLWHKDLTQSTVLFNFNEGVTVTVYPTQDITTGGTVLELINPTAAAKDANGNITNCDEDQINFTVEAPEGYIVTDITITGNYNKLKNDPEGTGASNYYRITKIVGDITVTITTELASSITGSTVTFNASTSTITVYDTQDITTGGVVTTTATAKDKNGIIRGTEDDQVNFTVKLADGQVVDSIEVAGTYGQVKNDPEGTGATNYYRITKVTSDITVTIITRSASTGVIVTFNIPEDTIVTVFDTQDITTGGTVLELINPTAYAKDKTGNVTNTEDDQINFTVVAPTGKVVKSVTATGTYNKIKNDPEGTGATEYYRITKITGAVIVTITLEDAPIVG